MCISTAALGGVTEKRVGVKKLILFTCEKKGKFSRKYKNYGKKRESLIRFS